MAATYSTFNNFTIVHIKTQIANDVFKIIPKRKGRSDAWKTFGQIVTDTGAIVKNYVCCRKCTTLFKSTGNQTTNLLRHKCCREEIKKQSHPITEKQQDQSNITPIMSNNEDENKSDDKPVVAEKNIETTFLKNEPSSTKPIVAEKNIKTTFLKNQASSTANTSASFKPEKTLEISVQGCSQNIFRNEEENLLKRATEVMRTPADEHQIFGDYVASELRCIKSADVRKTLKCAIQLAIVKYSRMDDTNELLWDTLRE